MPPNTRTRFPCARLDSPARVVEAGKSYGSVAETLAAFRMVLALAVFAALLLSLVGAYPLARASLSPVNAVVEAARSITDEDLSKRLPVSHRKDEIGRLATTVNSLLARLEAAFARRDEALERQRRFVADASDELRTPLTSVVGYAKLLEDLGPEDEEARGEGTDAIRRESQRMRHLVESLLALARGDQGATYAPEPGDLSLLVREAVGDLRAANGEGPSVGYLSPSRSVEATFDKNSIRQVVDILRVQCHQAYGGRWQGHGPSVREGRLGRGLGRRHRHGHTRGPAAADLREVLPGGRGQEQGRGRPRPLDSPPDLRELRRAYRGGKRAWRGIEVHAAPAEGHGPRPERAPGPLRATLTVFLVALRALLASGAKIPVTVSDAGGEHEEVLDDRSDGTGVPVVCAVAISVAYTAGRFSQDGGQARAEDRVSYQEDRNPANGRFGGFAGEDNDVAEANNLRKSAELSRNQAEESALNEVPGDVVGTELDDEYGAAVYQVDILANDGSLHEVEVDASGGDILSHTTEDQDDAAETRSLQERTSVSWEDAERSALGRFPGEVQGIELDDEDGRVVYNVEILGDDGNLHEATVDAASGDVLGSETEGRDGAEYESGIDD